MENDVPIVTNTDEIMPANYASSDLQDDINDIVNKMYYLLVRQAPRYLTKKINCNSDGQKSYARL